MPIIYHWYEVTSTTTTTFIPLLLRPHFHYRHLEAHSNDEKDVTNWEPFWWWWWWWWSKVKGQKSVRSIQFAYLLPGQPVWCVGRVWSCCGRTCCQRRRECCSPRSLQSVWRPRKWWTEEWKRLVRRFNYAFEVGKAKRGDNLGTTWAGNKKKEKERDKSDKMVHFSPGSSSKLSRPLIKTEKTGKKGKGKLFPFFFPTFISPFAAAEYRANN